MNLQGNILVKAFQKNQSSTIEMIFHSNYQGFTMSQTENFQNAETRRKLRVLIQHSQYNK